jgi:hypothetical protein
VNVVGNLFDLWCNILLQVISDFFDGNWEAAFLLLLLLCWLWLRLSLLVSSSSLNVALHALIDFYFMGNR